MWHKPHALMWIANLLYAAAVAMLLYGVVFLLVHLPAFPLREVRLKGQLGHVTREQVAMIVQHELKGNIFTINIDRVRGGFQKLPWVKSVSVRRRWPDTLEITVGEYAAAARWGSQGLLTADGEVFQAATDAVLPVLYGPDGSQRLLLADYAMLRQALAPLKLSPVQVLRTPRQALEARLNNGLVMELGREQADARLHRFVKVYADTVGRLADPAVKVDLRYPNGFAMKAAAKGGPVSQGRAAAPPSGTER